MFNSVCLLLILEMKSRNPFTCLSSPFRLIRCYSRFSKAAYRTHPPNKFAAKVDTDSGRQNDGEDVAQTSFVGNRAIQASAEHIAECRIRSGFFCDKAFTSGLGARLRSRSGHGLTTGNNTNGGRGTKPQCGRWHSNENVSHSAAGKMALPMMRAGTRQH